MSKKRAVDRKGKKQRKSTVSTKKGDKFIVKDGAATRKKTCLKCGPGVFMGEHATRFHCGKCGYVERKSA